jgi:hypothetical protein
LISALLAADFPGREALSEQLGSVAVRPLDENGSLELSTAAGAPRAEVVRRVPVEAELEDRDGVTVHVLLHVVDGLLKELEVYREDSGPLQRRLEPDELRLVVL